MAELEITDPSTWLAHNHDAYPNADAVIYKSQRLTHRDLFVQVAQLSQKLKQPGLIQVHEARDPLQTTLMFHAAPMAGSPFLPLDPNMSANTREAFLEKVAPDMPFAPHPPEPDAVRLIIATSGTTGVPKGVMLSGLNLAASAIASRQRIGLDAGDRWLACLPLFHIGGLSILSRCAEAGACVVLQDGFDTDKALAAMDDYGITHLSLVPTMLHRFLEQLGNHKPPGRLKRVLVGGAAISTDLAHRAFDLGWPICPTYGMSETSSQFSTFEQLPDDWREGQIGTPLDGFDVGLHDMRLKVRGPSVMKGYINPARTMGQGLEDGWFITNDLGYIGENGQLSIMGRADDAFLIGGETVHPATVERILSTCPNVDEIAVTARHDHEWGKRLVILYAGDTDEESVQQFANAHLKGPYRPTETIKQAALPRNAMGKLDRQALITALTGSKPD